MHTDWVSEYVTVHTSRMLMTFASNPVGRTQKPTSQDSIETTLPAPVSYNDHHEQTE